MPIITLTTDFGLLDGYVGTMQGVILSIAPQVTLVDLSHQVPAQNVRAGAFVLYQAVPYFPPETIHMAVVDPGVGSQRRALAVRTTQGIFVAPDNGVLSYVLASADPRSAPLSTGGISSRRPPHTWPMASPWQNWGNEPSTWFIYPCLNLHPRPKGTSSRTSCTSTVSVT
jgi:hypothetical protein